jgi:hypothetical protein
LKALLLNTMHVFSRPDLLTSVEKLCSLSRYGTKVGADVFCLSLVQVQELAFKVDVDKELLDSRKSSIGLNISVVSSTRAKNSKIRHYLQGE